MKKTLLIGLCNIFLFNADAQSMEADCSEKRILYSAAFVQTEGVPEENQYDANFVKLDLELTNQNNSVKGIVTLNATALVAMTQCVLELHNNLIVDSAYFNGVKRTASHSSGILKILAPSSIAAGNDFEVKIYYKGNPPNGGFFNGFSNATSPTWGNAVTWSLSEPNNASHWWPCKQVLTDKLDSSKVWITVDSSLKAGSNGVLEKVVVLGGKKRYEWNYPHPIADYLISVSVAKYLEYNFNVNIPGISNPVFVQNFIYDHPNILSTFKTEIDKTGDMLKVFSNLFGPYPFADMKYGHCMAPFSGGMEHNTMTTQGTFNTNLTAHELAHQWWGDYVTCKSWKDIWVNEGFARYCEYIYLKSFNDADARIKLDDLNRSVLSQPGGSVFVADTNNVNSIFNGRLTYDKGALVIHMIRFELNDDTLFFKILRNYLKQFQNGSAGVDDFKKVLELNSGRDFTIFFNQWYYGEGYPTIDLYYNKDKNHAIIKAKQYVSSPSKTARFRTSMELKIVGKIKDTTIRVFLNGDSTTFQIPFNDSIISLQLDENQWILNDTGKVLKDSSLHYYFNHVEPFSNSTYTLTPNPVRDCFQIMGLKQHEVYDLFDGTGRLVGSGRVSPGEFIDIKCLPDGMYFLHFQNQSFQLLKQ